MKRYCAVCLFILLWSCKPTTDEKQPAPVYQDLVSYSLSQTIPVFQVRLIASIIGLPTDISARLTRSIKVYRLIYKSSYKNAPIQASGIVVVPENINHIPIIAAQHGTIFAHSEAPSRFFFSLNNFAGSPTGFELLASFGYITVIPDYFGFGASESIFHPYLLKEPSAQAVTDMLKATREFLEAEKISHNGQLFLTGYSQGGQVTLAAQEALERQPIPTLQLTAVTAGAGPYNIERTMDEILKDSLYSNPGFLVYVFHAFNQHYDTDYLRPTIFPPDVANQIPTLLNGKNSLGTINARFPKRLDSLFIPNFLNDLRNKREVAWLRVFRENHTDNFTAQTPTRLFHGVEDEIVPAVVSQTSMQNLLNRGAKSVVYLPVMASSHAAGIAPTIAGTILWFDSLKTATPK